MGDATGSTGGNPDTDPTVEVAVDCRSLLGEGVTWDADSDTLLWLDVDGCVLHRLAAGSRHTSTPLERTTSVVVPRRGGGFIAVAGREVVALDDRGAFGDVIATLPAEGDGRANDGRVDPHGRLWVGTVDRSGANRAGLFCVDESGAVTQTLSGRALSNGIDWSPDGRRCYHADSLLRRIEVLELDEQGFPTGAEVFATFSEMPDGLTVDEDGGVWVALWDGGGLRRFAPDGRFDRALPVDGGWITSCAFGGADLRTLYITSANADLDADTHRRMPHAGSLFAAEPGVGGRGYTPFGSAAP
jgi:sugar lactone lactonase YvrE